MDLRKFKKYFNANIAKTSAKVLNIAFFCIHILFFIYFALLRVNYMVGVNVLSIAFYAAGFRIIKKDMLDVYVNAMAVEVVLHMSLATICVGMGCGFQLCLLAILCVFFYADYFYAKIKHTNEIIKVDAVLLSLISFGGYLMSYIYCCTRGPKYTVDHTVEVVTSIVMIILVFAINIVALWILTRFSLESEGKMTKQAEYDSLTGLPNRYYMMSAMEQVMDKSDRGDYWLAMVDIDNFKHINDTYGHNFGDKALKSVAKIISEKNYHKNVCRWGGEEFLMMGRKNKYNDIPYADIDDIRKLIGMIEIPYNDEIVRFTVTIGVASCGEDYSIEDWVSMADKKLYVGKYNGKNRVVF